MEVNGADYQQNEGPRELEIFSDEQVEEVMESLEYFKSKIEQLQQYCEQVNQSKLRVDETVLEQKRKHQAEMLKCQEEVNVLRSINIQLMSGKVASPEKRGGFSVSSLSCAIDAENAESRIQEMESKVRSLELTLAEKEKHVSVMEWQLMDMEATIATLQAERDQLILELELREPHENTVQGNELLAPIANENRDYDYHEDDAHAQTETRRETKARHPRRPHSDLVGTARGPENLSLKQLLTLSAEWSPKESPQRIRKPPQRHYSDYVKRDPRPRVTDFSHGNTTHSLEDFENFSEVDSGLGLGKLTRTTNFCDILDADEYSNFHVADNRLSFTGDSVLGLVEQEGNDAEPEFPGGSLEKTWETFGSEARKGNTQSLGDDAVNSPTEESFGNINMFEENSLASSTSDFSSAFHSSQDILVSSTDEPWTPSSTASCSVIPSKGVYRKKLSKNEFSKSDSCISASRSPPSDKDDMWNFTPDSILNVSTGEILIPSVIETPPPPSVKKSRSFTSSIEIILKNSKSSSSNTDDNEGDDNEGDDKDGEDNTEDPGDKAEEDSDTLENSETVFSVASPTDVEQAVTLRNNSGTNPRAKHYGKSRSVIISSNQIVEPPSDVATLHQKSLSDPVRDAEKSGRHKLVEYQKWRKYGRRGKPPGDLKISDC